jgi:hypothetical protein
VTAGTPRRALIDPQADETAISMRGARAAGIRALARRPWAVRPHRSVRGRVDYGVTVVRVPVDDRRSFPGVVGRNDVLTARAGAEVVLRPWTIPCGAGTAARTHPRYPCNYAKTLVFSGTQRAV